MVKDATDYRVANGQVYWTPDGINLYSQSVDAGADAGLVTLVSDAGFDQWTVVGNWLYGAGSNSTGTPLITKQQLDSGAPPATLASLSASETVFALAADDAGHVFGAVESVSNNLIEEWPSDSGEGNVIWDGGYDTIGNLVVASGWLVWDDENTSGGGATLRSWSLVDGGMNNLGSLNPGPVLSAGEGSSVIWFETDGSTCTVGTVQANQKSSEKSLRSVECDAAGGVAADAKNIYFSFGSDNQLGSDGEIWAMDHDGGNACGLDSSLGGASDPVEVDGRYVYFLDTGDDGERALFRIPVRN